MGKLLGLEMRGLDLRIIQPRGRDPLDPQSRRFRSRGVSAVAAFPQARHFAS